MAYGNCDRCGEKGSLYKHNGNWVCRECFDEAIFNFVSENGDFK